ncbi:MAG: hypothetical protein IKV85_06895 [Ruminococcus sp.]|nr:hypothetical protein [Ruminococcus sp.]
MKIILNFEDKDTFRKLERQAYDGTIDVTKFPPAEYKYFSELRKIYYAFKFEGLSKEEASHRKQLFFRKYSEDISKQERCVAVYAQFQESIRKASENISRIEKSHDVTEVAMLACETLGAMMGEDTFYGRQKKKLEVQYDGT